MLWKNWLINRLGSLVIVAGPRQARFFHGPCGVQGVYNSTGKLHRNEFTFSSSHTEMLFTFRPSLTKTELPCLLCGGSATSIIPGIFGLAWSLARCVSWRHRQWQCCNLHHSDNMDVLLADRPSTFADITGITPEGL